MQFRQVSVRLNYMSGQVSHKKCNISVIINTRNIIQVCMWSGEHVECITLWIKGIHRQHIFIIRSKMKSCNVGGLKYANVQHIRRWVISIQRNNIAYFSRTGWDHSTKEHCFLQQNSWHWGQFLLRLFLHCCPAFSAQCSKWICALWPTSGFCWVLQSWKS